MNNIGNITIERFAAFLDGNLPQEEMQHVADLIDSTPLYNDILGEVMSVDDTIDDMLSSGTDIFTETFPDVDVVLPEIPLPVNIDDDMVEVAAANHREPISIVAEASCSPVIDVMPDDGGEDSTMPTPFDINNSEDSVGMDTTESIDDNTIIEF